MLCPWAPRPVADVQSGAGDDVIGYDPYDIQEYTKNHPNSDLEDAEIDEASGAQRETTEQSFMPRKMARFDEREGWWRTMALEVMVKD